MKDEYQDDPDLSIHLETAKVNLQKYFSENYLSSEPSESQHIPLSSSASLSSVSSSLQATASTTASPKKNFTARFQRKRVARDELLEFWNLQQEDFESCDPLQWWLGRRAQFPNLYRLSCDIFSIPGMYYFISTYKVTNSLLGSAVAVERIFSGGRDTISLRRASLKPETIRVLMLVKRKLILAREMIKVKLDK